MSDGLPPDQVSAYLRRIGLATAPAPAVDGLRRLQQAHLDTVPFETLSMGLGEPIRLTTALLYDKIVRRHRGGFCYELNGLFAELLRALGFPVDLLAAATYDRSGALSAPFDHLALRVTAAGRQWLVDVGFGPFAAEPLDLARRTEQAAYRIADASGGDLDVQHGPRPVYRLETRARRLADFEPSCWWQQTAPESHFARGVLCSLPTPGGRVLVHGRTLVETCGERTVETVLATDDELLSVYRDRFGIDIPVAPRDPAHGVG